VICVYLFGSVFYEANEPSSTCRLRFKPQVEASTPPLHYFSSNRVFSQPGQVAWVEEEICRIQKIKLPKRKAGVVFINTIIRSLLTLL
jgi:hypothetical protein